MKINRRYVVEVAHLPFPAQGRSLIWHSKKFDSRNPDHKDQLSPSMVQVWEVQAVSRQDALANIMLGKGTALFK